MPNRIQPGFTTSGVLTRITGSASVQGVWREVDRDRFAFDVPFEGDHYCRIIGRDTSTRPATEPIFEYVAEFPVVPSTTQPMTSRELAERRRDVMLGYPIYLINEPNMNVPNLPGRTIGDDTPRILWATNAIIARGPAELGGNIVQADRLRIQFTNDARTYDFVPGRSGLDNAVVLRTREIYSVTNWGREDSDGVKQPDRPADLASRPIFRAPDPFDSNNIIETVIEAMIPSARRVLESNVVLNIESRQLTTEILDSQNNVIVAGRDSVVARLPQGWGAGIEFSNLDFINNATVRIADADYSIERFLLDERGAVIAEMVR